MACGADVLVLAAATGSDGYDVTADARRQPVGDAAGQPGPARRRRRRPGVLAVLHPHVGTMVETRDEVDRVLDGSAIRLCLDTGHLLIGGTDPLQLAREVPHRIAHAHLKDVDATLAARVQAGELTYTEAVRRGMYTPLGAGDVDIAGIVTALRSNGFDGWFVMEQDTILDGEPTDEGPLRDVQASVDLHAERMPQRNGMSLRIGVLGASRIADLAIVGPAQQLGHRLVAVAARDRGRAELFAEKHGVERVLGSYADVIADPEVDVDLQPAGELAARAVEPRGDRGGQAGAHRETVRAQPFRGTSRLPTPRRPRASR